MNNPVTVTMPVQGLTSDEAAERLAREGPNVLPERKVRGPLRIFISQFRSPFIYMLLAAAVVSWGLGQEINSYFILAVLILNALIGTAQEYSAARAAAALRKMVPYRATVIRDGKPVQVDTADVVPGDYAQLVNGDRVPADIYLQSVQ